MNKEEYRKHCEEQIERCIRLHDSKRLKEHELSLALLNECEERKQREDNLIKHLEEKIKQCDENIEETKKWLDVEEVHQSTKNDLHVAKVVKKNYQEILERLKSGKYE
jgi:hypothetical protein